MLLLLLALVAPRPVRSPAQASVTILYDAFGSQPALSRDWGFSALIEYHGKRLLFDTGNNARIFAANVRRLHVDLRRLDLVILSHRHADHTAGLQEVLRVNPKVPIYAPREPFGPFGSTLQAGFYRTQPDLPDSMRYFGGRPPAAIEAGTLWPGAHITVVDSSLNIAPGIRLVLQVSDAPGTRELRELSLVLSTPSGDVVIVGCSHPGIEHILAARPDPASPIQLMVGGLHLVAAPDSLVQALSLRLRDQWKISQIAPGHCTGEPMFKALAAAFGERYRYAGLGERLEYAE